MAWPKSVDGSRAAKLGLPLRLRRDHQPPDLLCRGDPESPNSGLGLGRIIGEGQHRNVGGAGERGDSSGFGGRQRSEYQAVVVVDRRLSGGNRAGGRAAGIDNIERRSGPVAKGKLGGLQQHLANVRPGSGHRQQHRDPLAVCASVGQLGLASRGRSIQIGFRLRNVRRFPRRSPTNARAQIRSRNAR